MNNKRNENLIALKELLKDTIREDAQNMCEFEEKMHPTGGTTETHKTEVVNN